MDTCGFKWTMSIAGLACLLMGTVLLIICILFGNAPVTFHGPRIKNTGKLAEKQALVASPNKDIRYTRNSNK